MCAENESIMRKKKRQMIMDEERRREEELDRNEQLQHLIEQVN